MRKQRFFSIAIILFLSFGMSSCISLLNEIKINSDKSGTAFIGIEVNALAGLINFDNDYIDKDTKNTILDFPNKAKTNLKGIKGISKIITLGKISQGRLGIQFDFKNTRALNSAYYALLDDKKKWYYPNLIKIKKHKVKIKNISPYIRRYINQNKNEMRTPTVMKYIKYRTIIKTPAPIKSINIKQGALSSDKKTMSLIAPLNSIMEEKISVGGNIWY